MTYYLQVLCLSTYESSKQNLSLENSCIGLSQHPEEFEHVHALVLSAIALSVAPHLQVDAEGVESSLQEILGRTQASSHILIQKAAGKAISIWQDMAAGRSTRQQSSASILEPFLYLLPL